MEIEQNVPLASFTTIGIGGPAKLLVRAQTVAGIREALAWAGARGDRVFVLGGGSNVLISDSGFDGLVLLVALRGVSWLDGPGAGQLKVAAAEPWDSIVELAVERGFAGIECLSGIPGSTGATPIQNVGAYGQEVAESIVAVEALDRRDGTVRTFQASECRFGYRSSLFKNHEPDRFIVLSVTFALRPGGDASVRYPELREYLEQQGWSTSDLKQVRAAVLAIRRRKGMVLDPADQDTRSDGSFFMNPIVTLGEYDQFLERATRVVGEDVRIPAFPSPDGSMKLSAAWLIERSGFRKGLVHGNVGLSSKHTLAIINRGGGTAREVLELVSLIQERVREAFGVTILPEPNLIG